ncbi:MAG: tetratricopeptide repeat protein [Kiritimatiellae bacterium]|nr:tetratricopeptide repeat protein [Kiritimatiellia bacterium]
MSFFPAVILAAVSVLDYPSLQPKHEELKAQLLQTIRDDDAFQMRKVCRRATDIFPEEPVWRYNLACSYAKAGKTDEALDALEKAIRLGYRNSTAISADSDMKSVSREKRFHDLLELADRLENSPIFAGPLQPLPAIGSYSNRVVLSENNLSWDFDSGAFVAHLKLDGKWIDGNTGDLYVNRDGNHSVLARKGFPGITPVSFDAACAAKGIGLDFPNMFFSHPVFGNCSRALVAGPMWRSLPRALMTSERYRLRHIEKFYFSNQVWVFPAVFDCSPAGTNGDVFASVAPYWIVTQGKSWSDQYYLRAALEISRSLKRDVKKAIVAKGLLAPTVQMILRKSLLTVKTPEDYLSALAHPTAFPANGLDVARLKKMAQEMTAEDIPPAAKIESVAFSSLLSGDSIKGELTYATSAAWGIVLRRPDSERSFIIRAKGADEYAFKVVHGAEGAAKIGGTHKNAAIVSVSKNLISPTNRVDLAVFGRNSGGEWGAPAFISFAVVDPASGYADPVLVRTEQNEEKGGK